MGIDKETKPVVNIVLDDNVKYLKELREQANEDGQNDCLEEGECKKLSLTSDRHSFDMEEYYFEERDCSFIISGTMTTASGKSYVHIDIPLSDTVMIDVLSGALKKLNKLKTAMETLK